MNQPMANFSVTFPVTLTGQWQTVVDNNLLLLESPLKNWLLDTQSLTARLKACSKYFHVQVIGEQEQICSVEDSSALIAVGTPILVREVLLVCDNVPQVFARSILPISSLTGNEQALAHLGDQPLGQVLFNNPSLKRQGLEVSSFSEDTSVVKLATNLASQMTNTNSHWTKPLWGRRSIFMVSDKPLMVTEVFLPSAYAYYRAHA
jgi:chorismate--pyruvate lyase